MTEMFHARESDRRELRVHVRWLVTALTLAAVASLVACASDEEKIASFKAQAEAYAEEDKLREAVIEYRNVLQIDPNDVDAHRGLAQAYLMLGAVNDAYWEFSETIRLDPTDRESRNAYAAISLANGRYDVVLEQGDAMVAQDPNDDVGYVLQAQAYERLGREAEVEPLMRRVIEENPEKVEYRLLLSNFFLRQGQIDKAMAEARAAIEIEETYAVATQMVRVSANIEGADDQTEQYIRRAIDLANQNYADSAGSDSPVDQRGEAYQMGANWYVYHDRIDEGVAILEEAGEQLTDNNQAWLELMFMLAGLHRDHGRHDEAAEVMRRAAASDESNPDPYLVLSTYRAGEEDFEGALAAAEQALAVAPTSLKTRLRHAEALIEYGSGRQDAEKLDQGRQEITTILEENPGLPEALFVIAKVALSENDADGAIEALSACIEAKPDWPQARLLLGTALMAQGEMARARVELALALELEPSLLVARRALIRIHSSLNEHEYAIDQGRMYLKRRPEDEEIRVVLAQSLIRLGRIEEAREVLLEVPVEQMEAKGVFALARIELASGNLARARTLLEQIEKDMPHHVRVLQTFASLDRIEGRMDDTHARIAAAVAAEPDNARLHELRGVVAATEGDLALAEESYKKAIELDPSMLDAYSKLATIYSSQGRIDETIAIYEKAVAEDPQAATAHHFLAVLYEMTARRELALEHYELAIAANDSMAESKNNLAYLLASSDKDLDRALTLAQEAKAAMPGNPNTADTLGWVLLKRGVPSAATGYFREALANMPPEHEARGEVGYHLGLSYVASGDDDDAVAAFQAALEHLDRQLDAAQAAGQQVGEPAWASQARAELQRLAG